MLWWLVWFDDDIFIIFNISVLMTLVKPSVHGLEPDNALYSEPQWVNYEIISIVITTRCSCALLLLLIYSFSRGLDFSTTWREQYEIAQEMLEQNLNITHRVMPAILSLWEQQNLPLLIDLSDIRWVYEITCSFGVIIIVCVLMFVELSVQWMWNIFVT